jgi:hypothetical protein
VIEDTIRPAFTRKRPVRRALPALLVLGTVVLLVALSPARAEAATTFTVNRTGDASDMNLSDSRCDTSTKQGSAP